MNRRPWWVGNVDRIAKDLTRKRNSYVPAAALQHPLTFGLAEFDWFYEDCDKCSSFRNASADRGQHEEINRPDIYGYYEYAADEGRVGRFTYDEISKHIWSEMRQDYDTGLDETYREWIIKYV